LIAAGTCAATAGFAPLDAAGVDVDAAVELELELDELLLLLLPHPAITATHSSDNGATNQLLDVRI
jgi:hypothetical protein